MALKIGSKKFLALDWDAQFLRMAVVNSRGHTVDLLKAVSVPVLPEIELNDAEMFGGFIRDSLKKSKISGKHAVISVPREKVVLNTINLPPAPAEELAAMVINQVTRELPFAADQAVIDFALSNDHDSKAPATALVAAVRIEDIEFYKKVASAAGLQLERVGLRPFANRQAVMATIDDPNDKTVLMVELGPEHSEISVIHDGTLKFSRSALTALPSFRDEAVENLHDSRIDSLAVHDARSSERTRAAVSALMVEVIRSFEAYRATAAGASIDRIVVCGATGLEAELSQSLAARFAALAELFNPAKALAIDHDRAKELRGFSVALGLAMSHGRHPLSSFDFLAPKRPISKRTRRMQKAPKAILTGVFLIATAVAAWFNFVQPHRVKANDLAAELRELGKRKKPLESFQDRVQALEQWADAEQIWPDELVRLTNALPTNEKVQVTRIEFHTRPVGRRNKRTYVSTVDIKLRTAELGVVNEISETLREMGYLDVRPDSEKPIGGRNESIYQFESRIEAVIPERKDKQPAVSTVAGDIDMDAVEPDDAIATDEADEAKVNGASPSSDDLNDPIDDEAEEVIATPTPDSPAGKPNVAESVSTTAAKKAKTAVKNTPAPKPAAAKTPPPKTRTQPKGAVDDSVKVPSPTGKEQPRKWVSIKPVEKPAEKVVAPAVVPESERNDVDDDDLPGAETNSRTRVRIPPVRKAIVPTNDEMDVENETTEAADATTAEDNR